MKILKEEKHLSGMLLYHVSPSLFKKFEMGKGYAHGNMFGTGYYFEYLGAKENWREYGNGAGGYHPGRYQYKVYTKLDFKKNLLNLNSTLAEQNKQLNLNQLRFCSKNNLFKYRTFIPLANINTFKVMFAWLIYISLYSETSGQYIQIKNSKIGKIIYELCENRGYFHENNYLNNNYFDNTTFRELLSKEDYRRIYDGNYGLDKILKELSKLKITSEQLYSYYKTIEKIYLYNILNQCNTAIPVHKLFSVIYGDKHIKLIQKIFPDVHGVTVQASYGQYPRQYVILWDSKDFEILGTRQSDTHKFSDEYDDDEVQDLLDYMGG